MSEAKEDHAYFRAVEETFIRLRGAPLMLSPKDWHVARGWRREGIPLDLVLRTLEDVFEKRRAREADSPKAPRPISSLGYCNRAVREAWEDLQELTATAGRREAASSGAGGAGGSGDREARGLEIGQRLEALAAALPEDLDGFLSQSELTREALVERITGLSADGGGDSRAVEEALARLDGELIAALLESLTKARRRALDEQVDTVLARLPTAALDPDAAAETRERLLHQRLRRKVGVPVLSLFAPEAVGKF